jgi:hypothetical protein
MYPPHIPMNYVNQFSTLTVLWRAPTYVVIKVMPQLRYFFAMRSKPLNIYLY